MFLSQLKCKHEKNAKKKLSLRNQKHQHWNVLGFRSIFKWIAVNLESFDKIWLRTIDFEFDRKFIRQSTQRQRELGRVAKRGIDCKLGELEPLHLWRFWTKRGMDKAKKQQIQWNGWNDRNWRNRIKAPQYRIEPHHSNIIFSSNAIQYNINSPFSMNMRHQTIHFNSNSSEW